MGMDVLKRVGNLLELEDVTILELLVEEEKTFLAGIRPVSFGDCLGPEKDCSILQIHVYMKMR